MSEKMCKILKDKSEMDLPSNQGCYIVRNISRTNVPVTETGSIIPVNGTIAIKPMNPMLQRYLDRGMLKIIYSPKEAESTMSLVEELASGPSAEQKKSRKKTAQEEIIAEKEETTPEEPVVEEQTSEEEAAVPETDTII